MVRKLNNLFEFYKSTLPINLAFSISGALFSGFIGFVAIFLSIGYITSLAIKEVRNVEHYIFYFNNGLPKKELWIYTYLFNLITILLLFILKYLFKI